LGRDLLVGREGDAVVAHRGEDLGVVVGLVVGIARAAAGVVPAVVPGDGDRAGGRVHLQPRPELTVGGRVVVDPDGGAPRRPVVVGVTDENVSVVGRRVGG